jgi:hypothetical protein
MVGRRKQVDRKFCPRTAVVTMREKPGERHTNGPIACALDGGRLSAIAATSFAADADI